MAKKPTMLSVSEAREKLTKLDQILKPGEVLEITRRNQQYARIELLGGKDRYQQVLDSIDALPESKNKRKRNVARRYKKYLYGERR